jgi:dimethylhistidine N-methyltransferase
MRPLIGDFIGDICLPDDLQNQPLLGFFPGSTIGNLTDEEAVAFLSRARKTLGNGKLLIGIDLIKDHEILLAAYNDSAGVTATFNKNLLVRINRELDANFDLELFVHRALWKSQQHRIEMHLVARSNQRVTVSRREFCFRAGESIHTENCHKYTVDGFSALARRAGWLLEKVWTSDAPEFAVLLLA